VHKLSRVRRLLIRSACLLITLEYLVRRYIIVGYVVIERIVVGYIVIRYIVVGYTVIELVN
jgi:hypothetical protein